MDSTRPIPDLSPTLLFIAADLLDKASNEFSRHGGNDYRFPACMTAADRVALDKAYHAWNGDPDEEPSDALYGLDSSLMTFLSNVLRKAAGDVEALSHERAEAVEQE